MRTFVGLVLAVFLALGASPARSQEAGAYYSDMEEASASWLAERNGAGALFHFITGGRYVNPIGGVNTLAIIGKARCRLTNRRGTIVVSCRVIARIKFIRPRDFELDPLARSARIVVKDGDRIHRAGWVARNDTPKHNLNVHGDPRSVTVDAWIRNRARAKGRVLGARFSTRANRAYASISKGAGVGVIYELLGAAPVDLSEGRVVSRDAFRARFESRSAAYAAIKRFVRSL